MKPVKKVPIMPSLEEDADIQKGIEADPDNPEWTEEMFRDARPASEVFPDIVARYRKSRGKQKAPTKVKTTMRFSPEVLEYFKSTGDGWQTRMDAVLKAYVASH